MAWRLLISVVVLIATADHGYTAYTESSYRHLAMAILYGTVFVISLFVARFERAK